MKKTISMRVDEEVLELLDKVSVNSGYNRTLIVEEIVKMVAELSKKQTMVLADFKYKSYLYRTIVDAMKIASSE